MHACVSVMDRTLHVSAIDRTLPADTVDQYTSCYTLCCLRDVCVMFGCDAVSVCALMPVGCALMPVGCALLLWV